MLMEWGSKMFWFSNVKGWVKSVADKGRISLGSNGVTSQDMI